MDPVANLTEQLEIAHRLLNGPTFDYGTDRDPDLEEDAIRLAELVEALDSWRRSGGYDPYAV